MLTFVLAGLRHGSTQNFQPLFSESAPLSILLVLQIVPYFMTGFESIGKASEEASSQFQPRRFLLAIMIAMVVGIGFYVTVIAATAYVAPWQSLVHERFATAVAFEHAVGSRWIVSVIMGAALLSLLEVFNGNFVAATRLLFALGRRGLADSRLGYVHPVTARRLSRCLASVCSPRCACSPANPSLCRSLKLARWHQRWAGWQPARRYLRMRAKPFGRAAAATGIVVTLTVLAMKVLPTVPGALQPAMNGSHLLLWILLGLLLRRKSEARREAAN